MQCAVGCAVLYVQTDRSRGTCIADAGGPRRLAVSGRASRICVGTGTVQLRGSPARLRVCRGLGFLRLQYRKTDAACWHVGSSEYIARGARLDSNCKERYHAICAKR